MKTQIKLTGDADLYRNFSKLKQEVQVKLARRTTNAGAQVIKKLAISNAPKSKEPHKVGGVLVQPGNLRKNIVVKKAKDANLASVHIVTVRGKRKDGYAARYGRLVEFGTIHTPPRSFLRKALAEGKGNALDAMLKTLAKGLNTFKP